MYYKAQELCVNFAIAIVALTIDNVAIELLLLLQWLRCCYCDNGCSVAIAVIADLFLSLLPLLLPAPSYAFLVFCDDGWEDNGSLGG